MQQKKSISAVKKGMSRDVSLSGLQNIDYTFALNANTVNESGDSFNIQNEPSNYLGVRFPTGYKVIRFEVDVLNNRTYYFLTNPATQKSSIGYVSNTIPETFNIDLASECLDCSEYNALGTPLEDTVQTPSLTYIEILNDICHEVGQGLNFSINFPIKFLELKQKNGDTLAYFNDYRNPPRWINLTNTAYLFLQIIPCETDIILTCFNPDKLLQFPKYNQMQITPDLLQTGGQLKLGAYEFYAAYCDILGNESTQYCTPTNPIKIFDENNSILEQTELDSKTNYAIKLKIENLDTDFQYYKVVVAQRTNVNNTQAYFIEGIHATTEDIVIYSSEDNKVRVSKELLFAVKPRVARAKGLEEVDSKLIHWGIETKREVNLQPVVNLMGGFLQWQSSIAKEDLYKSAIATSKYVGYPRNEVQPFAIRFNFKDEGYTANFPFIARPANSFDLEVITEDINKDSIEAYAPSCSESDRNKRWQFFNTATEEEIDCVQPNITNTEVVDVVTKKCTIDSVAIIPAGSSTFELSAEFTDLQSYIKENPDEVIVGITPYLVDPYINVHCMPNFGTVYTSGTLVIGATYIIYTLEAGDNFTGTGFTTITEPFIAEEQPTVWTNGTEVTKTTCDEPERDDDLTFNSISEVINEVAVKNEVLFPDEYSKLKKPNSCFIYEVGDSGIPKQDIEFKYMYMYKDETIIRNYRTVYNRDFNFSNTECAYSEDIVNTNDSNISLQGYFHDYMGAPTLAELQTTKNVVTVDATFSPQFTNKIHKGALWFKGLTLGRTRFLLEVSKQNNASGDDDIISDIANPQQKLRITIYNKCSSTTELYSEIFKADDGIQLFLTNLTSTGFTINNGVTATVAPNPITSGNFYVVIDTPIVTASGVDTYTEGDNGQSGTITSNKFRLAPPDGCFSIVTREPEYASITVTWDSINITKTETYTSNCTFLIPKVGDCDPIPYKKGKFSYFESTRTYPDNEELYNSSTLNINLADLADLSVAQKALFREYYSNDNYTLREDATNFTCAAIRHPKFPDNTLSPLMSDLNLPSFSESYIFPLGVTIDNDVVKTFLKVAVRSNLLTQEEFDNIDSYEILRADNIGNKSIVANGLAYDMYKYTEKGKDIYYANYPHNDLGEDQLHYADKRRTTYVQHPFLGVGNNKYSFISPDLLLSREQLPTEVLFSGYQTGNSRGFINEVENHPKWTILGQKAKNLALRLAIGELALEFLIQMAQRTEKLWVAGGFVFGSSIGVPISLAMTAGAYSIEGFLKVGQYRYEWLKIFRDLGAKYNFAEYSVSEGFHNKFLKNEDTTNYLRGLSTAQYLKDARRYSIRDEKTGENVNVNCFQREYSVFLSLGDYSFTYNLEYQYNDNYDLNPNESSRTISSENDCDNSEINRNVGSQYLTLKDYIPDQYGEIDSLKWLTTNYINKINTDSSCQQIFGGTYYISRFSYKRKLPFFIKTSYNLTDRVPFNYYDYKNIAYPKFYCNYEEDSSFNVLGIPFPDVDSNYIFDCQTPSNRMYIRKPSKFYLWYYGIASFIVESEINCNFRYGNKEPFNQFYPQVGDMVEWTQEKNVSIKEPNTFYYNDVYSLPVSNTPYKYLNRTYSELEWEKRRKRENSVLISERDNSNGNEMADFWLIYKPLSFFDLPVNNGTLSTLKSIGSQQLLAIYDEQLSVYGAIDSIQTSLNKTITEVGKVGNLFEGRPIDILNVGSGLSEVLETPYGYFFVDEKRGKIGQYLGGDKVEIISEQVGNKPTDMRQWFKEHIPFKILRQLSMLDVDNKYKGIGFNLWYDERQKRVFFTKRDYVLKAGISATNFAFNKDTLKLTYQTNEVFFDNALLFEDVSWTISFKPEEGSWSSYWSFYPDYSPSQRDLFQVGYNWGEDKATLWNHTMNNSSFQVFQGRLHPFIVEYPIVNENVNKMLNSISLNVEAKRYQSQWDFSQWKNVGFNKVTIYNNTNHSGDLNLIAQKTLSDTRKYPITNLINNTQSILFTALDGKHNINYFFNRIINQDNNIPMSIKDKNNIFKETNPRAVSFKGKRVNERLKGEAFLVRLENDAESRLNIVLKSGINDETISK